MQVLPCSSVHYAGESNSASQTPENAFGNAKVDNFELNAEVSDDEQFDEVDDQKLSSNTHDSGVDSLDGDDVVRELPGGNQDCESSRSEPRWLELDQPMAVWVKWRGKWKAGIRCARSDWPLSIVRSKPTHDRKQYLVIFFPRKRTYSWADVLLLRPINEFPEPIAYRSHTVGVKVVKDLTIARRFIIQKIAVSMINTIEQLNSEALTETARSVVVWKDFASEASRCRDYSDLGSMLLKLENMILQRFIDSFWLEHSLERWVQQCQKAHSAESIEMLKEELGEAINWNEVHTLSSSSVSPEVGSEWKTLKPEVMKWFSMLNPSTNSADTEQKTNDRSCDLSLEVSRKRPKLEIRRAELQPSQFEPSGSTQVEIDSRSLDYPSSSTTDRCGEIVVEAGNNQETRFKDLEATPVNKNKQCTAFIEAKGRRCVRWANDGEVYCCVHLGCRFSGNLVKTEVTRPPNDAQMCEGTTFLGTKCKHRSLSGTSFCKKHRSKKDTEVAFTSSENSLKRKLEEGSRDSLDANTCQEMVLLGHFGSNPGCPFKIRRFKKGLLAAPFKIRNHGAGSIKKHIRRTFGEIIDGESRPQESISLGGLLESECLEVAKFLCLKINKTKPRPGNLELLSVVCSSCCKVSFQVSLEKKYGILPERLYLKAVKLCSEHNVLVEWHQDGFICHKGCKLISDSDPLPPLTSLSGGSIGPVTDTCPPAHVTSEWAMDECHYIVNFSHPKDDFVEKATVLCDDISFGKESVQIACVVDEHLLGSLHGILPWESFMYITKPLLDWSLDLGSQSIQLGCGCAHSTCSPKACDHVYLFDNDYEDARDIYGKSMNGRFPYDDQGRIILEEGYLVYECNKNCNCNENCLNRVLQNGVRVKLEVFKTEDKGWGVRAGQPIDRGTFVCEYIGEVIDEHEAKKRHHRYAREGCSFIYEIDARINDIIRLIEGEPSYAIDATKYGNVSRYINHSCSPNLEIHQVLIECLDSPFSHIGLYASRDIAVGETLSFDYMYKATSGKGCQCRCGAVNCRGLVC